METQRWSLAFDGRDDLEAVADELRREAFAEPEDGRLQLELGIVLKLLGRTEPAFGLLERALELLPAGEGEARHAAQFVLGLTWGDVGEPARAVERFEAAAREGARPERVRAARAYAAAYREHHGVA